MNAKKLVPVVPVAAVLAVCTISARAPGGTINAFLGKSSPGNWIDCATENDYMWSEATGYNASLGVVCRAADGTGSTATSSCSGGVFNQAKLWSTEDPSAPIMGTQHCAGPGVWWTQMSQCSKTVSVKPQGGQCSNVTFTASSWGTN
jgi:hypothetical protein